LFELITGAPTDTVIIATQAISFLYTLGFDYFQDGIKLGGDSIDLVMFGLGGVTILAGTMLAATIVTTLVFAKLMLSILLAVGPIFIVLFLFGGTRRLFEAWLGQLLSNVILIVIFGVAINLVLNIMWEVLKDEIMAYMAAEFIGGVFGIGYTDATPSPVKGLGIVMISYVCYQLLAKIPPVADSIGRSLSLNLQTGLAR
jgi:type IV secretion system protein VirB6